MKGNCRYCGGRVTPKDECCPYCGMTNEFYKPRAPKDAPQTIAELRAFADAHNMPLKLMRFYIGEDFREPRAFGIYKDITGNFVVYKNKENGVRAIRYQGPDEAYAVNELYQKMKSEVQLRQQKKSSRSSTKRRRTTVASAVTQMIITLFVTMVLVSIVWTSVRKDSPDRGYYTYQGNHYYYQQNHWYQYNVAESLWQLASSVDSELDNHPSNYWERTGYSGSEAYSDFADSGFYREGTSSSSSSWDDDDDWDDSDWDYDFDSWDSYDTDWSSDW